MNMNKITKSLEQIQQENRQFILDLPRLYEYHDLMEFRAIDELSDALKRFIDILVRISGEVKDLQQLGLEGYMFEEHWPYNRPESKSLCINTLRFQLKSKELPIPEEFTPSHPWLMSMHDLILSLEAEDIVTQGEINKLLVDLQNARNNLYKSAHRIKIGYTGMIRNYYKKTNSNL